MENYNKKILTVTDLKKSYVTKENTYPVLQGINIERGLCAKILLSDNETSGDKLLRSERMV